MKTLVFFGGGPVSAARSRLAAGASILAWGDAAAEALRANGIRHVAARDLLTLADADAADEAAIAWTRAWGKRPLLDGLSFRQLYDWKGVSLWWFAELYLHHSTGSPRRVRLIETFLRLLEREAPDDVEAIGLATEEALLLARACLARGLLFHDPPAPPLAAARRAARRRLLESRWNEIKTVLSAVKARLGAPPTPPAPRARRRVLFVSHAAFWRERSAAGGASEEYEHYFDRLIPETARSADLEPFVLELGPRAAFRRRGLRQRLGDWLSFGGAAQARLHVNRCLDWGAVAAVRQAGARMRRAYAELRKSPALGEVFSHRGVRFDDLALPDLAGTLLLQLPWAVRCCEEIARALAATRPAVVCLYAESSGWGRAVVAAAREAGVPSLGVQHGILYPTYYSYRHAEDEADCPRPDRTAVFGEAARRFLVDQGRYPPESLVVTGSSKFDELLEASRSWDRAALRAQLGVGAEERLLLVASRFRGIRETHQSIGSAFPSLLRAVACLPRARLLVKPHPAESGDDYRPAIRDLGAGRAALLPPEADLLRHLFAADALVTVESLAAVEALVLGRPVLVLNMPTNLRQMVEAGVALGVPEGGDPAPALAAVLDDDATLSRLAAARRAYLDDVASGVDGRATERLLGLLRRTSDLGAPAAGRAGGA